MSFNADLNHNRDRRRWLGLRLGLRSLSFTLVELLIVITIVGILAAVAIPQFGDSSRDAQITALDHSLKCVRAAIERYKYEHNDLYPGQVAAHATGDVGFDDMHVDLADAFSKQMTFYSNVYGDTSEDKSPDYPYGPYLTKGVPANPLPHTGAEDAPASVTVTDDPKPLTADAAPSTGWKMSYVTGQFIANNPLYDKR